MLFQKCVTPSLDAISNRDSNLMVEICFVLLDKVHMDAARMCITSVELCGFVECQDIKLLWDLIQFDSGHKKSEDSFYFA